jgi:hypothetical protein
MIFKKKEEEKEEKKEFFLLEKILREIEEGVQKIKENKENYIDTEYKKEWEYLVPHEFDTHIQMALFISLSSLIFEDYKSFNSLISTLSFWKTQINWFMDNFEVLEILSERLAKMKFRRKIT